MRKIIAVVFFLGALVFLIVRVRAQVNYIQGQYNPSPPTATVATPLPVLTDNQGHMQVVGLSTAPLTVQTGNIVTNPVVVSGQGPDVQSITNGVHAVATDGAGNLTVSLPGQPPRLPLFPCNPVRVTNCQHF